MCGIAAVGLGMSAASTGMSIFGGLSQASTERKLARRKQEVYRRQAALVLESGRQFAADIGVQAAVVKGSQVAAASSTGFDVMSPDVVRILDQKTSVADKERYLTLKNAEADAWSLLVAGNDMAFSAKNQSRAAAFAGLGAGIAGVGRVATDYAYGKKAGVF